MRVSLGSLLRAAAWLVSFAAAEFTYDVRMFEHGVEVPVMTLPLPDNAQFLGSLFQRKRAQTYSYNWCGAVQSKPAGTFESVYGVWNIPDISLRSGQSESTEPYLYEWVGIDGYSCSTALLQAGTGSWILRDGSYYYAAWWYFWPNGTWPEYFANFPIAAGDKIAGTVNVTSSTSGILRLENLTRGTIVQVRTSGGGVFCGQDAEWILEDAAGTQFPKFTDVTFISGSAQTSPGAIVTPNDAILLDTKFQSNGEIVCDASVDSSGVVQVVSEGS